MIPNAENLFIANLQPEIILSIDVKRRNGRRRRDKNKTTNVKDLFLFRFNQVAKRFSDFSQEFPVSRMGFDVVQRNPRTGLFNVLEYFGERPSRVLPT